MFRVLTLIFTKKEGWLLGAHLSVNSFEEKPSATTLMGYTRVIQEKFLYPENLVIESHPVIEGSYVNFLPMEVANV